MILRSLASLRLAAFLAALLAVSACTDDRLAQLSQVETIDIPAANAGPQANQNINNPTLEIPVTYPVKDGDELALVFEEEFDGPEINPQTWFFATGDGTEKGLPGGWGNNELQYYLPDNAMIVNGVLEITARRETVGDLNYTSARINTEDRFAFKYGRIEASIKLPAGQGLWPAFWMLSQDSDYVCGVDDEGNDRPCVWAATGEIDIMEAVNLGGTGGNEIFGTLHYGGEGSARIFTGDTYAPSVDVTEDFHTYALEWDEDEIRWYFDGLLYAMQNSWSSTADNGGPGAPFNQPFHILLNLAVGGNLPGDPNGTTPFPATMEVDWVRVYSGEEPATEPADPGITPDVVVFAADGSTADLTPGYDPFGSGSSFATVVDSSYANALEVTVGAGYAADGSAPLAQLGLTGLTAGFATGFDEFVFKVKGLTADNTILAKLEVGGVSSVSVEIDLTAPPTNVAVTDLGDGWSQVVIQMVAYGDVSATNQIVFQTLDAAYAAGGTFLLTDIGFNNAGGGTATGGEVPEVVIFAADGSTADLTPGYDPFGSGSSFATVVDSSYANALEVTVGAGYAADGSAPLAQLGLTGLTAGFATGFDEFVFKVKGLTADNTILAKLEVGGVSSVSVEIDLTAPPTNVAVTDLGDGWSQVVIQMVAYGDVSATNQIVFQTLDAAYAAGGTFLLTDIGFNNAGGGTATGGEVPEVVIFAADGSTADLTPGYDPFGSGSSFATVVDSSYANALEVTVGAGYAADGSAPLAQLGLTGLTAGFATGFDEFVFKVKGLTADNTILAKLEVGGVSSVSVEIDLTVPPANVAVTDLGDGWSQVVIQMVAYGDVSATNQIVFQTLDAAYAAGDTFLLTDIGFNNAGGGGGEIGSCGATGGGGAGAGAGTQLAVNGDFESGDLTGWTTFTNGGTITVCSPGATGTFAGKLDASGGPFNPTLKQANLAAGQLMPGQAVTVSFDWKGVVADGDPIGAVFDARLFSELDGGGISQEDIILNIPDTFPANWTTVGPQTFNIGSDVSGGVTLQFNAACGGNAACVSEVFIDNVSITIN